MVWTDAAMHPTSNGLVERAVQIVKHGLKKVTSGSAHRYLAQVLLSYRISSQMTTGVSPSELLLSRRPRTTLDLVKHNTGGK